MSMPTPDRPRQIEGLELAEAYGFLDALRESGITNMWGATPYLREEFDVTRETARTILVAWMEDFSEK